MESHTQLTPDGKTLYFLKGNIAYTTWTLLQSSYRDGKWSTPEVAPFSGAYADADSFITADGHRFFFISNRALDGKGPLRPDLDIWMMERQGSGWSEPRHLPEPINSDQDEWFPTVTRDGTLYFGSERLGGQGGSDIYRAARGSDGAFLVPENLGRPVNTPGFEYEPLVSPDGRFMVLAAAREGGMGSLDLYLSYQDKEGNWSEPKGLEPRFNTRATDIGAKFSPDGRLFFFSRVRQRTALAAAPFRIGYSERLRRSHAPQNGLGDLYVVDARALGIEGGSAEALRRDGCRESRATAAGRGPPAGPASPPGAGRAAPAAAPRCRCSPAA
ncbi:hypothetical protein KRR26_14210 [Corallococcus sp. M34]|uniref:hypothetical protein n=1 Tax=Citreicoccus inhibens TaxID=2849499 RepID=UPI001C21CF9B|nr:hypothetical protein [Citreicoccus inhibens]MBU8896768.1 hypothetical protein [Citreicoccus inhibens]